MEILLIELARAVLPEVDVVGAFDTPGNLVFGKAFNLNDNQGVLIPDSLSEHVFRDALLHHYSVGDSVKGIILLPEGPLLVSSQPRRTVTPFVLELRVVLTN